MTDLTRTAPRTFQGDTALRPKITYAAGANVNYLMGMALIKAAATGAAALATPTASGKLLGFVEEPLDNRTGAPHGGTLASAEVTVALQGLIWLTVAKAANFARGDEDTVYCSDSDTFTVDAGTNNIVVGKIVKVPEEAVGAASGVVLVWFQASALRSI